MTSSGMRALGPTGEDQVGRVSKSRRVVSERVAFDVGLHGDPLSLLAETRSARRRGDLTGTELVAECALRRDVVYGDHKDLEHRDGAVH